MRRNLRVEEQATRRTVLTVARLDAASYLVGLVLVIPAVVVSRWVSWLVLLPLLGTGAFVGFWWAEKRRQAR